MKEKKVAGDAYDLLTHAEKSDLTYRVIWKAFISDSPKDTFQVLIIYLEAGSG